MLTIVPTPIGNLKDISLRAIEVLKESDLILAEDTRKTGILKKHFSIDTPTKAYHTHNEHAFSKTVIEWLKEGKNIALVSDAGTPGISDPGFFIVRECKKENIEVITLPGATAFVPALVSSGLPCDRFFFEGFLPHKKGRLTKLKWLATLEQTFILYESPFRLLKCLKELSVHCGADRMACVARELTKIYEETTTDTLQKLIQYYEEKPSIKGEIVVIVASPEFSL